MTGHIKKLSIVIPTSGRSIHLHELLKSIQTYFTKYKIQTIVVSNPVNLKLNNLSNEFTNIHLSIFQLDKMGANHARQFGLENSENEFVLFLDDDCCFTSQDQINDLYNEITDHDELFAVGGYYQAANQNLNFDLFYKHPM